MYGNGVGSVGASVYQDLNQSWLDLAAIDWLVGESNELTEHLEELIKEKCVVRGEGGWSYTWRSDHRVSHTLRVNRRSWWVRLSNRVLKRSCGPFGHYINYTTERAVLSYPFQGIVMPV